MRKGLINIYSILFNSVLFCIYILPLYELECIGFSADRYLFLFIVFIIYAFVYFQNYKTNYFEIGIIIFAIAFSVYRRDLSFLHIISIALIYKVLRKENAILQMRRCVRKSNMPYICLVAVFFYSGIYFGEGGRYIHSSILDPNMSGLAIFCLFTIIRIRNKRVGNFLLFFGMLTFSKSYLLALVTYYLLEFLERKHISIKINYALLSLISIFVLVGLSVFFVFLESAGKLQEYGSGFNHFFIIFNYSNYYRFTVNTNVLNIYREIPSLLISGMTNPEWYRLNFLYSSNHNIVFFRIRPHNYLFSYMQIYGIWSILIFAYTYKIFKCVLTEENNKISLPIFLYLMFLGIGATHYWLYLSIFTLIAEINVEKDVVFN